MNNQSTYKYYIVCFLLVFGSLTAIAQAPYINSINPSSASVGEVINISGSNFTGVSVVLFGGTRGTNLTILDDNLITVEVPFGATFDQVSLLHTTNGSGYSIEKFNLSFDGQSIDDGSEMINNVSSQTPFATGKTQTQDLCTCDFDNDGKLDVAVSNAGSTDGVIIYINESSAAGTVDFVEPAVVVESRFTTTNVICGDIDGDGFPDLVANQLGNQGSIYTYLNDGAGNFATGEEWVIPTNSEGDFRKPGRLALGDLDLDGLPEIAVATEDENIVYYFKNTSTSGNINFVSVPLSLSANSNSGSAGLGGLDIADMNNDGFPEIITSNFTESGFYIFQNNSQIDDISFNAPLFTPTGTSIRTLKTGDLDNDGFMDVILTNSDISSNNVIEIVENTTTTSGTDVVMGTSFTLSGIRQSWGLDLGDIDGDDDLDIIIGSEIENGFYTIMNTNSSTIAASSYSVGLVAVSNANNARNIVVADVDSDGRPDFIYANKSTSSATGNLALRLNEVCYVPVIRPDASTALCDASTVNLIAPASGFTYKWMKDGGDLAETSNTLLIDESDGAVGGDYTVIIEDNAGCQLESAAVTITTPGESFDAPTITVSDNTACSGDDILFNATAGATGTTISYVWTGPNDFTSTDEDHVITGISADQSGEYYVTATSSAGCEKSSAVEVISVTSLPIVSVQNPALDFFCEGNSLDLSATDFGTDYTYDWKLDNVSLGESDPSLLVATTAGDYSISISDGTCTNTSAARNITSISAPTSSFTASDVTICEGVEVDFTATSTGDHEDLTVINNWDYAGEGTDMGNSVSHAFATIGDKIISLTAKYDGIADDDCDYQPVTQTVSVEAAPTDVDLIISDNTDANNFEKCAEADLRIRVDGTFESYNWIISTESVGSTAVLDVSEESTVYVELENSIKCQFSTDPVNITNYTNGGIEIGVQNPNTLEIDPTLGKVVNVEESTSIITLGVLDATDPAWEPAIFIEDTTLTTVQVAVKNNRLIKVYGIDALGCQEVDSVTLRVPGIRADKNFTPNGDGIGDCWSVSNVGGTDCKVVIFDSKGRRIRELSYNADSDDDCVWEGDKSNGSPLPDGVYYYFLSCSDSENESSGSIFMVR
ncbi:gliding motility-associated C-terminal domain-containing protein [Reichenbachiella faecimaris]|uniref:Gliding motility-associated C-terminal domain-containing protein n=1 Tax=Reichenbachiella faecimaris TaxID=692418 RepID=A0A1W2G4L8_REIFA|nr:FG-GAP-like repeat-containing protein [Reichenbachiella faecimaris]SMD31639.1 gliding motility-associated C-terminal domain-containing protein [Reichenbachiella faecimaris]